jgi:hypothetical protein
MKNIVVEGVSFEFFLDRDTHMWRLIDCSDLLPSCTLDIEISLSNFNNGINWNDVEGFIRFFKNESRLVYNGVEQAKMLLKSFFALTYKDAFNPQDLADIEFSLSGIDFKGHCGIEKEKFHYDMFFFPYNKVDKYKDIGALTWRAFFRDALLLGVYCDYR